MRGRLGAIGYGALTLWTCLGAAACAQRAWMLVPAKVDLSSYERLGLVELEGPDPEFRRRATRELQERLLQARPGVLIVELGERKRTDPDALRELAREHDLGGVFAGSLVFSEPSPSFGVASSLVQARAKSEILATLTLRLVEPTSGATAWMRSADRSATVTSVGLDTSGTGSVAHADRRATKIRMIGALAEDVTHDFRDRYFRKKAEEIPPDYRPTYPDGVEVYVPPEAPSR